MTSLGESPDDLAYCIGRRPATLRIIKDGSLAKRKLFVYGFSVAVKPSPKPRSGCPVGISLDLFGDRWSLLIVRDMMVRGLRTFSDFQHSGENISTNILAGRLRHLQNARIIVAERATKDARSIYYRLTSKGIALAPVLLEIFLWAAHHETTGAPAEFVGQMEQNRKTILAETYRRWEQRDPRPLIPPFKSPAKSPKGIRKP